MAKTVANLVASLAKGEEGDPGGAAVRNKAAAVAKAAVVRSSRRSFLRGRDKGEDVCKGSDFFIKKD